MWITRLFFGQNSGTFTNSELADSQVLGQIPWVFCQIPWVFCQIPWVFSWKLFSQKLSNFMSLGTISILKPNYFLLILLNSTIFSKTIPRRFFVELAELSVFAKFLEFFWKYAWVFSKLEFFSLEFFFGRPKKPAPDYEI